MERGREGPTHYSWLRGTMIGGEFYSTVQRPRFEASRGIEKLDHTAAVAKSQEYSSLYGLLSAIL